MKIVLLEGLGIPVENVHQSDSLMTLCHLVGMEDALLERYAKDMLKKEDQVRGIVERVLENKVFDFVKSAVKLDNKTVTMEQMQELYK